jgi:lysophospholipase L1-like esterase
MKNESLPSLFWLGDSISVHYYPYLARYLEGVACLEVRSGYREAVENINHPRGSNCGDSSMVLAFLESLLAHPDFEPTWIVFNCGLHDIKTDPATGQRQVDTVDYVSNLGKIISLIRSHQKTPVWITTTPVDDARHHEHCPEVSRFQRDVDTYNALARDIMVEQGVPIFGLHDFTARLEGELYMDHVHYTDQVRQIQAAYLTGQMERLLQN